MEKYTDKERVEDFRYFVAHYDEFFRQYGVCSIVIRLQKVIGVYDSFLKAYESVRTQSLVGACIIQECSGDASAYTDYFYRPVKFAGLKVE